MLSLVVASGILWYSTRWNFLLVYFLTINIVTFLLYFWDKIISATKIVRVPEVILHTMALVGGSPASLLAQNIFHHKTRKTTFLVWYWLIVLMQILLIIWLLFEK